MVRLRRRSPREAPSRCCVVRCHARCFVLKPRPHLCAAKAPVTNRSTCDQLGRRVFFLTPSVLRSRSCPWSCEFLSSISLCRCLDIFRRRQGGVSYAGRFLRACARWIAPTRPGRTSRLFACCSEMSHGLGRNALFSVSLAMHVWRVKEFLVWNLRVSC